MDTTGHWKTFGRLKVPRYIIVTETLCGDSYEWTTDEDGNFDHVEVKVVFTTLIIFA